jgi:hypothetical protein
MEALYQAESLRARVAEEEGASLLIKAEQVPTPSEVEGSTLQQKNLSPASLLEAVGNPPTPPDSGSPAPHLLAELSTSPPPAGPSTSFVKVEIKVEEEADEDEDVMAQHMTVDGEPWTWRDVKIEQPDPEALEAAVLERWSARDDDWRDWN